MLLFLSFILNVLNIQTTDSISYIEKYYDVENYIS